MDQRVFAVRGLGDFELAVLDGEPGPAGAELRRAGSNEIGLELVIAAEVAVDGRLKLAGQLVAAARPSSSSSRSGCVVVVRGRHC